MKKWFLHLVLAGIVGMAGLGLSPTPAAATCNAPPLLERQTPGPLVKTPADGDFSDAAFTRANQPQLGTLTGGDAGGILLFILLVVLLVLLIMWLVHATGGGHERIEIRGGANIHNGDMGHRDHDEHMDADRHGG